MTSLLQEKLYEAHTQAPPPSKDFHHLTITKNEVKKEISCSPFLVEMYFTEESPRDLRNLHLLDAAMQLIKAQGLLSGKKKVTWQSWRITFRPNQERICPREVKKPHKDFLLDEQLHKQMQGVFGKKTLDYILSLCQGQYDFLHRMPDHLIIHILSFLNTGDIRQLSQTCKRFRQLCNTEEFWEKRKKVQDKYTLDIQTVKVSAYKKPTNFRQRPGSLPWMQRRQTTFF